MDEIDKAPGIKWGIESKKYFEGNGYSLHDLQRIETGEDIIRDDITSRVKDVQSKNEEIELTIQDISKI